MQYDMFSGVAGKASAANDGEALLYMPRKMDEQGIIEQALEILAGRLKKPEQVIRNPDDSKNFARLRIGDRKHEVFGVFYLNHAHGIIAFEELFRGTLTQTSVYPREVVINALAHNAAAVIFTHNHPSGNVRPSVSDESLTTTLKNALALVDVRVIDHLIVSATESFSMAEHGLM